MAEHIEAKSEGREDRDSQREEGEGKGRRSFHRKKVCRFCADTEYVLDYKDARMMQSYMMDLGKIVPRRISGTCAYHQRKLTIAVKRARNLALVGFTSSGPNEGGFASAPRGDRGDRGDYRERGERSERH